MFLKRFQTVVTGAAYQNTTEMWVVISNKIQRRSPVCCVVDLVEMQPKLKPSTSWVEREIQGALYFFPMKKGTIM